MLKVFRAVVFFEGAQQRLYAEVIIGLYASDLGFIIRSMYERKPGLSSTGDLPLSKAKTLGKPTEQ